jgi:hypothetical protein
LVGTTYATNARLRTGASNISSVYAGLSGSLTLGEVFFGNLAVVVEIQSTKKRSIFGDRLE